MASGGEDARVEEQSASEVKEPEGGYGSTNSVVVLLFNNVAAPDEYAGMEVDLTNAPLPPLPTAVPPPPPGGCQQRQCKFHAAECVREHQLSDSGLRQAVELAAALERYALLPQRSVVREATLALSHGVREKACCV